MCERIKADEAGHVETFKKVKKAVPVILLKPGSSLLRSPGHQSPSLGAWMEFLISLQPGLLQRIYLKSSESLFHTKFPEAGGGEEPGHSKGISR